MRYLLVTFFLATLALISCSNSAMSQEELGVPDSRLAVVPIANTLKLNVYAKGPTGKVADRNPFYHEQFPQVRFTSSHPYDSESGKVTFDLSLTSIPPIAARLARQDAATAVNDADAAESIVLLPLELEAYRIFLQVGNEKELLAEGLALDGPYSGNLPVSATINNLLIREALMANPADVRIVFQPFYRFQVYDLPAVKANFVSTATRRIFEDVFGAGGETLLVTREGLNTIQQETDTTINMMFSGDTSAELASLVEAIREEIFGAEKVTAADLSNTDGNLYYSAEAAQIDISPIVLKEITSEWSNEEQFRESFSKTWSELHEMAKDEGSASKFYNRLFVDLKSSAKAAGKFDLIKMFNAGGSTSGKLDVMWEKLSSGEQSDFAKFFEQVRDSGSINEGTLRNVAETFVGTRDLSKVTPASIELYRVSRTNLRNSLSVAIGEVTSIETRLDGSTELLDLVPGGFASVLPVGAVMPYAGEVNANRLHLDGWLPCDGRKVSKADFPLLWKAIGSAHGDEQEYFNLPDYRGRFLRGVSSDSGRDPDVEGRTPMAEGGNSKNSVGSVQDFATAKPKGETFKTNTIGNHQHTGNTDRAGRHGHKVYIDGGQGGEDTPISRIRERNNVDDSDQNKTNESGEHRHGFTTERAGNHSHEITGGGDTETRPTNAYVNWIIRVR